ncbi:hypothetical protein [Nonomuraea indica]|uniref:Uncharacterized protein n=1 Tax=Nonomuraea indica TaxID=1581193 RepID=A0ABW8A0N5_9ACTN
MALGLLGSAWDEADGKIGPRQPLTTWTPVAIIPEPRPPPEALSTAAQQHHGKPNEGGQQKDQHHETDPKSDLDVGHWPA